MGQGRVSIISEEDDKTLRDLLDKCGAILRGKRLFITQEVSLVLDIDKVWHEPETAKKVLEILLRVFENCCEMVGCGDRINTVLSLKTKLGSLGIIPIAAALAFQANKRLVILEEFPLEHLRPYPSVFSPNYDLRLGNVAITYDAIFMGTPIASAIEYIQSRKGSCMFVLAILDLGIKRGARLIDELESPMFTLYEVDQDTEELKEGRRKLVKRKNDLGC